MIEDGQGSRPNHPRASASPMKPNRWARKSMRPTSEQSVVQRRPWRRLSAIVFCIFLIAEWLGGQLADHHHLGVTERARAQSVNSTGRDVIDRAAGDHAPTKSPARDRTKSSAEGAAEATGTKIACRDFDTSCSMTTLKLTTTDRRSFAAIPIPATRSWRLRSHLNVDVRSIVALSHCRQGVHVRKDAMVMR